MSATTAEKPSKKPKMVPESFSWPEHCKAKILSHQGRMIDILKRKVTLPEAFAHFVENAKAPEIIAE